MGRQRYNYLLFRGRQGMEPTLAGSFSSRKRAGEAIMTDAREMISKCGAPGSIEHTRHGAILRIDGKPNVTYHVGRMAEDRSVSPPDDVSEDL